MTGVATMTETPEAPAEAFWPTSAPGRDEVLQGLVAVCRRAAEGDFEVRVPDLGADPVLAEVREAVNLLLDRTDAFIRESGASLVAASEGRFHRRFLLRGMAGAFRSNAAVLNVSTQAMARSAELSRTVAQNLSSSSTQLTHASRSLVETTTEAADQATAVAAATEEMNSSISEIAQKTSEASSLSVEAGETAKGSVATIEQLRASSTEIGGIVQVISGIARQTRLLALNASIEAARAGIHGVGFAVVADEVKNLAQETADATTKVESMVETIQHDSRQVAAEIVTISDLTSRIGEHQTTIAAAVEEQLAVSSEIARNVAFVAASAGKTREVADSLQDLAGTLATESEDMRQLVDRSAS